MDNPNNGVNSFPNGLSAFPMGITTNMADFPSTLDDLIHENDGAKNYFDNMEDSKKAELIRNAKDFQSKEELERYLYHIENEEFR